MKIYLVGGAVRDKLLKRTVHEKDYVVVGATVKEMLAQGFKQVGKDFPVFLHPITGEEYALARRERKVQPGYKGFTFDTNETVTLEDDLKRRDFTINAMAETPQGTLIDPYHGLRDLKQKCLRHVSPHFAEDPVRILRAARFLARYASLGFHLAPETMELMKDMVKQGEVNALVAERVWKELERALGESHPEIFFETLRECGALSVLFPELLTASGEINDNALKALTAAKTLTEKKEVRFAALLHALSKEDIIAISKRYKIPSQYQELALLVRNYYKDALTAEHLSREALLNVLMKLDIFRRPVRLELFLKVSEAIATSQSIDFDPAFLNEAAQILLTLQIDDLLKQDLKGQAFAYALYEKRLRQLEVEFYNKKKK